MKKNLKIKSLFGALAFMVIMSGNKAAKADLTEDDGWNREGAPTYVEISQEENDKHTQDNLDAQEAGEKTPAPQDGEAKISDVPASPIPTVIPTGTDWENYDPSEEDLHPSAGLEDEIERKDPTPTPTQPIPKTGDESNVDGGLGAAGIVAALASVGVYVSIHQVIKHRRFTELAKQEEEIRKTM